MRDLQSPAAIRSTLQYVVSSDAPAEHKAVLIEAVTRLLRTQESEQERQRVSDVEGRSWQADELTHLDRSLDGKLAKSWQDADETLLLIASQLHRRSAEVRTKAVERGFTAAVDFAAAKAVRASRTDD
jgi:hypothetical protein